MKSLLEKLNLSETNAGACTGMNGWLHDPQGSQLVSYNPTTGEAIGSVIQASAATYDRVVEAAQRAFTTWRMLPAPKRGLLVRDLGTALRDYSDPLGEMVTLEMGKIRAEGIG